MKRAFLFPLIALSALSAAAWAKPSATDASEEPARSPDETGGLARSQLSDAASKALSLYSLGDDVFAFSLERAEDGTLVAQHRSHYSHQSHSSHRSHYSSRQ